MTATTQKIDDTPQARVFIEKIGDTEYELLEATLDVFDDVTLWPDNPRLQPYVGETSGIATELELESFLQRTPGYAALYKSIADIGQMEPVYAWKRPEQQKYIIFEGATRVSIKRDLARKSENQPTNGKHRRLKAKILPAHFGHEERAILLARIHVRGSGVRSWGRYIEAKFVYDHTTPKDGEKKPLLSVKELADHMAKSISWVSRLRDAYEFARTFVDYVDADDGEKVARDEVSTLEEISKSASIGPKLREYQNPEYHSLRAEVFDMVRNGVFKEYRDARFMKQFHEDPEKWAALKTGEKGIASKLAAEIRAGSSSLKANFGKLEDQIKKSIQRDPDSLAEEDLDALRLATAALEAHVNPGVRPFLSDLVKFTRALTEASLADIKAVQRDEMKELDDALEDFRDRLAKHKNWE